MIDPESPYYEWDGLSIGSLHRRAGKGDAITNPDLVRIIEAEPHLVPDEILREYVLRGLRNKLKAKRGRKRSTSRMLRELYVLSLYDDLLPRLQARAVRQKQKGIRKSRGDYSSAEYACALIANRVGMATPEGVRNLVSSLNNRP